MKKSCGILLKRGDLYLIGHSTQPDRKNGPSDGNWTIFKGEPEPGEGDKSAAYREFKEETNIDLRALGLDIEPYKTYASKYKQIVVFICNDENEITANIRPVCNSFVYDGYPEIDNFKWVTAEDARRMVFYSHRILFDK